jgi:hypothetical protein
LVEVEPFFIHGSGRPEDFVGEVLPARSFARVRWLSLTIVRGHTKGTGLFIGRRAAVRVSATIR